jgi:hypothetical protein
MGFPKYGGIGGKGGNVVVVAEEGERMPLFKSAFSLLVCDVQWLIKLAVSHCRT